MSSCLPRSITRLLVIKLIEKHEIFLRESFKMKYNSLPYLLGALVCMSPSKATAQSTLNLGENVYKDFSAICGSAELSQAYIDAKSLDLQDGLYFQSVALGVPYEDHIETSLKSQCENQVFSVITGFTPNPVAVRAGLKKVPTSVTWSRCKAKAFHECDGDHTFKVEPKHHVCRFDYTEEKRNRANARVTHHGKVKLGNENLYGYNKVKMKLWAQGNQNPVDRWSSKISVSNIELWQVKDTTSIQDRRDIGCELHALSAPATAKPKKNYARAVVTGSNPYPESPYIYEVKMVNNATEWAKMRIFVFYKDKAGREHLKAKFVRTKPPESTTFDQFVSHSAVSWRLASEHVAN